MSKRMIDKNYYVIGDNILSTRITEGGAFEIFKKSKSISINKEKFKENVNDEILTYYKHFNSEQEAVFFAEKIQRRLDKIKRLNIIRDVAMWVLNMSPSYRGRLEEGIYIVEDTRDNTWYIMIFETIIRYPRTRDLQLDILNLINDICDVKCMICNKNIDGKRSYLYSEQKKNVFNFTPYFSKTVDKVEFICNECLAKYSIKSREVFDETSILTFIKSIAKIQALKLPHHSSSLV